MTGDQALLVQINLTKWQVTTSSKHTARTLTLITWRVYIRACLFCYRHRQASRHCEHTDLSYINTSTSPWWELQQRATQLTLLITGTHIEHT
jgi:hypothetical protein